MLSRLQCQLTDSEQTVFVWETFEGLNVTQSGSIQTDSGSQSLLQHEECGGIPANES